MINHNSSHSNENFRTIPIYETFFSDTLTPIDVVNTFGDRVSYLLESKDDTSAWGRYSFVGLDPFAFIKKQQASYVFEKNHGEFIQQFDDIQTAIEGALAYLHVKPLSFDFPFYGGAVGYVGYDAISDFESIKLNEKNGLNIPPYYFVFCNTHIIFDHKKKNLTVLQLVHLEDGEESGNHDIYKEAYTIIQDIIKALQNTNIKQTIAHMVDRYSEDDFSDITSNYTKKTFVKDVKKIQNYIKEGDIFQAVLSQRFQMPIHVQPLDVYRVLRTINPSPYLFFINIEGATVVGSSPERLVNVTNQNVEIHPIAGTRKRGLTKEEDDQLASDLLGDVKENAEHMMLVDLARNDVGRIAKYGTVNVPVLMEIGRFSQVMHLVSKVTGKLAEEKQPMDAFISSFPAGTVSGAPKIRAMEIIDELEPTSRGLYAGAVGYIGYDQTIDTCIAIRTIVIQNNTAYVQAGAGIVADSIAENEWEETRNKARALLKAIRIASKYFEKTEESNYA